MYLSCLLIDVGDNPDRPRPGRLWLRNRYRVHQRLCMAFPYPQTKANDPAFLSPYQPCGFRDPRPESCAVNLSQQEPRPCATADPRPVHVPRDAEHNFLFRVDPQPGGSAAIIVLSALEPDWDYAFHNARHLLRCCDTRPFSPTFSQGQALYFRLLANPTKRLRKDSLDTCGRPIAARWIGNRVPVNNNNLEQWLVSRSERCGFHLIRPLENLNAGYLYVNRTRNADKGQRLRYVRYDGVLEVADPVRLRDTLITGIGPAKAFGFGLLSVAPAPGSFAPPVR